ncbi:MAG TPA: hypothetical protein DCL54_07385, partial [Alphaproteobacteria bacterium]|nr:hypothetical protein [Alphaproteobacteria bacterium]
MIVSRIERILVEAALGLGRELAEEAATARLALGLAMLKHPSTPEFTTGGFAIVQANGAFMALTSPSGQARYVECIDGLTTADPLVHWLVLSMFGGSLGIVAAEPGLDVIDTLIESAVDAMEHFTDAKSQRSNEQLLRRALMRRMGADTRRLSSGRQPSNNARLLKAIFKLLSREERFPSPFLTVELDAAGFWNETSAATMAEINTIVRLGPLGDVESGSRAEIAAGEARFRQTCATLAAAIGIEFGEPPFAANLYNRWAGAVMLPGDARPRPIQIEFGEAFLWIRDHGNHEWRPLRNFANALNALDECLPVYAAAMAIARPAAPEGNGSDATEFGSKHFEGIDRRGQIRILDRIRSCIQQLTAFLDLAIEAVDGIESNERSKLRKAIIARRPLVRTLERDEFSL